MEADLLLHVVDVSHPQADEQIQAVNLVLDEIGAANKPTLMVFNKVDLLQDSAVLNRFLQQFPQAVGISATTGEGIPQLMQELGSQLRPHRDLIALKVPYKDSAVVARLHALSQVVEQKFEGSNVRLKVHLPPYLRADFARWIVDGEKPNGRVNGRKPRVLPAARAGHAEKD